MNGFVQTVFADVEPPVLGATYCPPAADVVAEYLSDISDGAGIGALCLDEETVRRLLMDNP